MQPEVLANEREGARSSAMLLGAILVVVGASSYGMLSTIVKVAYQHHFTTAEVAFSQYTLGALVLTLMSFFLPREAPRASLRDIKRLVAFGMPLGLTSLLYYASVQYIDASIAVVLLLQSVWMGVVIEAVQKRELPTAGRIFAVLLILFGTLLATDALNSSGHLSVTGFVLGFIAAMSFATQLYATSAVARHLPTVRRSQFMLYGGVLAVMLFAFLTQVGPYYLGLRLVGAEFIRSKAFDPSIFLSYGLVVAIFGTVIPPLMMNKGFPIVGVGLGSILSSAELPFTVLISFLFLGELVNATQWLGVAIILLAIFMLNYKLVMRRKRSASSNLRS